MSTGIFEQHYALSPEIEELRLLAVEQLYVLDTPPEERFAQITRVARSVFGVPISGISLLDRDRQWFKQLDGLDVTSVPRPQVICAATVCGAYLHPEDPSLIVEDIQESEFRGIRGFCTDNGIRFYAGYPLYGPNGHAVGAFGIYDRVPRELTSAQRDALSELATWAQRELQKSDDLQRAATVQRQLLPPTLGDLAGYTVSSLCVPAYAVGGDFYDHYPVADGIIFSVADVMGKGLGAAILTAVVRSALRGASRAIELVAGETDLVGAVKAASLQLVDDLSSTDSFVTLFHMKLTTADGSVQYVDAGHGFAAVFHHDGTVEALNGEGLPLGIIVDDHWIAKDTSLQPGDTLVIASDGIMDLAGDGDDLDAVLKFIAQHPVPADLCATARALSASKPTLDDITIVAIRRDLSS